MLHSSLVFGLLSVVFVLLINCKVLVICMSHLVYFLFRSKTNFSLCINMKFPLQLLDF